jgi:hypothetical protein
MDCRTGLTTSTLVGTGVSTFGVAGTVGSDETRVVDGAGEESPHAATSANKMQLNCDFMVVPWLSEKTRSLTGIDLQHRSCHRAFRFAVGSCATMWVRRHAARRQRHTIRAV